MTQPSPRVGQSFFLRPTLEVAELLLGKLLVRRVNGTLCAPCASSPPRHGGKNPCGALLVGKIVETEAYCGAEDLACHASRGKTKRTAVMFGPGGYWYIYLIYGIHHCLNIVTEREGYPAAVLIRAVEPMQGFAPKVKTNGPGKVCRAYQLTRELNGACAFAHDSRLWVEECGGEVAASQIAHVPRIGVDYAREYKDRPWRFYIIANPWVSRPKK